MSLGASLGVCGYGSELPLQGAQIPSLAGELRFPPMPCGAAKEGGLDQDLHMAGRMSLARAVLTAWLCAHPYPLERGRPSASAGNGSGTCLAPDSVAGGRTGAPPGLVALGARAWLSKYSLCV